MAGIGLAFHRTRRQPRSRAAFYQIPASSCRSISTPASRFVKLGEEARVLLPTFTLEGSKRASLRYALKRGDRDGLQFEIISPDYVASVMDEIEIVSNAWLSKHRAGARSDFRSPLSVAIRPLAAGRAGATKRRSRRIRLRDDDRPQRTGDGRVDAPRARRGIALCDGIYFHSPHPAVPRTGLPHLKPRRGAAFRLPRTSPGATMASPRPHHVVVRPPFL